MRYFAVFLFAFTLLSARAQGPVKLDLVPWANGIGQIVGVTNCGDDRLFAVSQWGAIFVVPDSMTVLSESFLNISDRVINGGERGMLGLAFDPDYANNGFFYVNYMRTGGQYGINTLSRFSVSEDPNVAIDTSEVVLFSRPHHSAIHQAGDISFGLDSMLYVALGDGGWAADPANRGQDLSVPFGKLLRIKPEPDSTYSIPTDNPFYGAGPDTLQEIFAYGLRNPYRIGIDRANGDIWIGDVGQESYEEIDHWPADSTGAPNFGWRCYEGNMPFNTTNCDPMEYKVPPVLAMPHSILGGTACAVIGGKVYRGEQYPRLLGRYFYSDFCSGEMRMLAPDGEQGFVDELGVATSVQGISSFGESASGELFVTNLLSAKLFKVVDLCPMDPPEVSLTGGVLNASAGDTFQWLLSGDTVPGATDQEFTPLIQGYYSVLTNFNGACDFESDSVLFLVTGVGVTGSQGLEIFPQPAYSQLTVRAVVPYTKDLKLRMYDQVGRMVQDDTWRASNTQHVIDVEQFASGTYVLELRGPEGEIVDRRSVSVLR
ncbi:MAG: PQQ-dependent sugar dehydrogenase [Flavobacteriales bacterium]